MHHFSALPAPGQPLSSVDLSRAVGGPDTPFRTGERLSTRCEFFADDERLVAVALEGTTLATAGLLLAWGLAHRHDRRLSIVLPRAVATPTLARAPWFVPEPAIYTYPVGEYPRQASLTRRQSLDFFYGLPTRRPPAAGLGPMGDWAGPLEEWAAGHGLQRDVRNGRVTWKHQGTNLLSISRAGKVLRVVGGVQSTSTKYFATLTRELSGGPEDAEALREVQDAVDSAIEHAAHVDRYPEHALQAALTADQFGLTDWAREVPAWRPESRRAALIDFVGWEPDGRLHLVETKIGADAMLVLQGLDYWLWATANLRRLLDLADSDDPTDPVVDFVVRPKSPGEDPISIYTSAQAEALDSRIPWRFHVISAGDTVPHPQPERTVPAARRAGARPLSWSQTLRRHMQAGTWLDGTPIAHLLYSDRPEARLLPEAQTASARLQERSLLHGHHRSALSSQRFALNMLAPLTRHAWAAIAAQTCGQPGAVVVDEPVFEYMDPVNVLGEGTGLSPHQTQVDCLARFRLPSGGIHALLIEVKLTEQTFGVCSAALTTPWPDRCATPGPFGGLPEECFQLHNKGGRAQRRTYDEQLGDPAGAIAPEGGCWFRDGANQVMRNVALANALIRTGLAASATFALMAPKGHTSIWAQWQAHSRLLSRYPRVGIADLPAESIAAHHDTQTARELTAHYLLTQPRNGQPT